MDAPPVLELFLELAAIPSPPGEERAAADHVLRVLRELGLDADEDGAGPRIGSTMGNVYARLEPTAEGTPLFREFVGAALARVRGRAGIRVAA